MGQQWKNAPVYFTVAQIRYNPVLSLSTYVSGIQEYFRKNGFPDFKKMVTMTLNLSPLLQNQNPEAQPPAPQLVEMYSFSSTDNTKNFLLDSNALAFQTSSYVNFEQFVKELVEGLDAVHRAVGLDFIDRIGVRYLDAVMPKADETLGQYLNPDIMGLYEKLKGVQYSFSETLIQAEGSSVRSRTLIQHGQVGFPPDILPAMTLKVAERFRQFIGMHAIIDTDAFYDKREPFSLAEANKKLCELHDKTSSSFHTTITEHAQTAWA